MVKLVSWLKHCNLNACACMRMTSSHMCTRTAAACNSNHCGTLHVTFFHRTLGSRSLLIHWNLIELTDMQLGLRKPICALELQVINSIGGYKMGLCACVMTIMTRSGRPAHKCQGTHAFCRKIMTNADSRHMWTATPTLSLVNMCSEAMAIRNSNGESPGT